MYKKFLFTLAHLLVLLHLSFSLEEGFAFSPLDFETSKTEFTEAEKANIELIRKMENIKKTVLLKDFLTAGADWKGQ